MDELVVVAAVVGVPLALVVLTAVGARARGMRWTAASVVGAVFPITWVAWYVRDELPRRGPR